MNGWILLYRKILNHPFYLERRVFSHWEAWVDLLLLANHEDHEFHLGKETVQAHRGEVITSEIALMERWRWSKAKVRWFLNRLQKDRSIDRRTDHKKTTIVILNYDTYQKPQTTKRPLNIPDNRPVTVHNQISNKEEKKLNKLFHTVVPPGVDTPESPETGEDQPSKYVGPTIMDEIAERVVAGWNRICGSILPKVTVITPKRKGLIRARFLKYDEATIESVFIQVASNPFMCGGGDRGWKADFDWVMTSSKFLKIVEGAYEQSQKKTKMERGMENIKAVMIEQQNQEVFKNFAKNCLSDQAQEDSPEEMYPRGLDTNVPEEEDTHKDDDLLF